MAKPSSTALRFARTHAWQAFERRSEVISAPSAAASHGAEGRGVNIYSYFRGQFGLAESARLFARALIGSGYPVAVRDLALDIPHSLGDVSLTGWISDKSPYDVDIVFVNADYFQEAIAQIRKDELSPRYRIGCWFWELERFPQAWLSALDDLDEVIVASEFVARAIRAVTDKPVICIPLPVIDMPDSGLTRHDFGIDDNAFVFLCTFDFHSFVARKNPLAVIAAFRRAFGKSRHDVRLLIKSSNGDKHPDLLRGLIAACGGDARILIRDDVIDREHVQALQRCVDAYISLHRAEGFGLGMAESMLLGKPVIATRYSGNLQFMDDINSVLVDYKLIPVSEGEYVHADGQAWADPLIDDAAKAMRSLADDREHARAIGERARIHMQALFSPEASASALIAHLESLPRAQGSLVDPDVVRLDPRTSRAP